MCAIFEKTMILIWCDDLFANIDWVYYSVISAQLYILSGMFHVMNEELKSVN